MRFSLCVLVLLSACGLGQPPKAIGTSISFELVDMTLPTEADLMSPSNIRMLQVVEYDNGNCEVYEMSIGLLSFGGPANGTGGMGVRLRETNPCGKIKLQTVDEIKAGLITARTAREAERDAFCAANPTAERCLIVIP